MYGKNAPETLVTGTFVVKPDPRKGLEREMVFKSRHGYENRFEVPKKFRGENLILVAEQDFNGNEPVIIPETLSRKKNVTYYQVGDANLSTAFNPNKRGAYAADENHFLPVRHRPGEPIGKISLDNLQPESVVAWIGELNKNLFQNERITFKAFPFADGKLVNVDNRNAIYFETEDGRRFYFTVGLEEKSLNLYKAETDASPLSYVGRSNEPFVGFVRRRNSMRVRSYYPPFDICGFDVLQFGDSPGKHGAVVVGKDDFSRLEKTARGFDEFLSQPVIIGVGEFFAFTNRYRLPQRSILFKAQQKAMTMGIEKTLCEILEAGVQSKKGMALLQYIDANILRKASENKEGVEQGLKEILESIRSNGLGSFFGGPMPSDVKFGKLIAQVQKPSGIPTKVLVMKPEHYFAAMEKIKTEKPIVQIPTVGETLDAINTTNKINQIEESIIRKILNGIGKLFSPGKHGV